MEEVSKRYDEAKWKQLGDKQNKTAKRYKAEYYGSSCHSSIDH